MKGVGTTQDLLKTAVKTHKECVEIVKKIHTTKPSIETIQLMDDLSNSLCKVMDICEFLRNNHSDQAFVRTSAQICGELGVFMENLNTDMKLYTALKDVTQLKEYNDGG